MTLTTSPACKLSPGMVVRANGKDRRVLAVQSAGPAFVIICLENAERSEPQYSSDGRLRGVTQRNSYRYKVVEA